MPVIGPYRGGLRCGPAGRPIFKVAFLAGKVPTKTGMSAVVRQYAGLRGTPPTATETMRRERRDLPGRRPGHDAAHSMTEETTPASPLETEADAPDRNLALELVRVTEAAAMAAARWVGRGTRTVPTARR